MFSLFLNNFVFFYARQEFGIGNFGSHDALKKGGGL
jgi:hypothetical protein